MNYKKIIKLYNIPVNYNKSPKTNCAWDGKSFNFKGIRLIQHKMHEICHYIVAKRKNVPEFGLGPSDYINDNIYANKLFEKGFIKSKSLKAASKFTDKNYNEECQTCVLEFLFAIFYGKEFKELMMDRNFLYYDSWNKGYTFEIGGKRDFRKSIIRLIKRKIITKDWIPSELIKCSKPIHIKRMNKYKKFINTCK